MKPFFIFICLVVLLAACINEKNSNAEKTSILTGAHWNNQHPESSWHFDFKDDGTFNERFEGGDDKKEVISMQGTWEWVSENEITLTTKFMTVQKEQQPIDFKRQEDSKKTFRFTEITKDKLTGLSHANGDAENSGFAVEFTLVATAL